MIYNYLKIAIRSLYKQLSYTAINVVGLSTGIASFLLIMLYIQYHLGFDSQIPDQDQWYRIVQIQQAEGVGEQHVALNMGPLSERLSDELPEVIDAVRVIDWGSKPVRAGNSFYNQNNVVWADPAVFRLFGIKLLLGDSSEVLNEPKSVVLCKTLAVKYFGSIENAIGQNLGFNNETGYVVTGIMNDQPLNTHLHIDMMVSYESALISFPWLSSWGSNSMPVYVKLIEGCDHKTVAEKINAGIMQHYKAHDMKNNPPLMYLQPVSDIHLHSNHIKFQINHKQGDYRLVLVFVVIALLIIFIACINFINLAIACSVKRAKEVGIRKVMGANRANLIYQFLGESVIISFMAILFALVLVELSLPEFNRLLDNSFSISFSSNFLFNIGLLLIWIFISLLSGIYPALFMSRFQAADVLKGIRTFKMGQSQSVSGLLSRALVVFQFLVAITLVFVVLVTNRQIHFALTKDLGYNYEKVLAVYLQGGDSKQKAALLKPAFQQLPGVKMVAAASFVNGVAGNQSTITTADSAATNLMARFGYVDEDFFPLMEIPIVAGRNFSHDFPNDHNQSVILNQAAVAYFGWDNPIGKVFNPMGMDTINKRIVIGVISDYHYYSIRHKIEPAAWILNPEDYYTLCVKYQAKDITQLTASLGEIWNSHYPDTPFEFVEASTRLKQQYQDDQNSMKLFTMFTFLSLLISVLGLYGLTALRVEQRTKEIGIRKVLGGSVEQIIRLIIREFLILVVMASVLAIPLGFYFSTRLLNQFAYAVDIGWFDVFAALALTTTVALTTIIIHARRAALANPVKSLKYE